jgi:hypothetical protein
MTRLTAEEWPHPHADLHRRVWSWRHPATCGISALALGWDREGVLHFRDSPPTVEIVTWWSPEASEALVPAHVAPELGRREQCEYVASRSMVDR